MVACVSVLETIVALAEPRTVNRFQIIQLRCNRLNGTEAGENVLLKEQPIPSLAAKLSEINQDYG